MGSILHEIRHLYLSWLGKADYELSLMQQLNTAELVRHKSQPRVLGCEHNPVITLGKRSLNLDDILVSMDSLRKKGIKIVGTDRGGQATLHNPGQLVLYPILPLRDWGLGIREYIECLERSAAFLLAEYGLEVVRGFEPGLWVDEKKIASFGIRVDRGVSFHGLAINIKNNLSDFELIKSCGRVSKVTNVETEILKWSQRLPDLSLNVLAKRWVELFTQELLSLPQYGRLQANPSHRAHPESNPEDSSLHSD